ncbi:MAG TPA: hypothetical protein VFQ52_06135, partial [Rhizomicrobium sp.]|nr:hypothetical protein [Rhizomicrobium sp.]
VIAEGISMAIQSSGLLAQMLIAGESGEAYARTWRRRFAPRIHAASLFAHLAMRAPGASLAVIRRCPALLDWGARLSGKAA